LISLLLTISNLILWVAQFTYILSPKLHIAKKVMVFYAILHLIYPYLTEIIKLFSHKIGTKEPSSTLKIYLLYVILCFIGFQLIANWHCTSTQTSLTYMRGLLYRSMCIVKSTKKRMDKSFYFLYAYSFPGKNLNSMKKNHTASSFFTHGLLFLLYFSACGNIWWEWMYFKGSQGIILDKCRTVRFIVLWSLLKILLKLITNFEFKFSLHQALEWNLRTSIWLDIRKMM
jgi:hypothetical protein